MAKGTFNYQPHVVCGGKSRSVVRQGPRPEPKEQQAKNTPSQQTVYAEYVRSLGTHSPMPEAELVAKCTPRGDGHYLSKEKGEVIGLWAELKSAVTGKAVVVRKAEPQGESVDEWLRRHRIGKYAQERV